MKSTTAQAATETTEYTHTKGNLTNTWNIRSKNTDAATDAIAEYYQREEMAVQDTPLDKAHSRHHALVASALGSSLKLATRDFPKYNSFAATTAHMNAAAAAATTTTMTLSSAYQKHHLVTLSAMCGLLATRLHITGHSRSSRHNTAPQHLWRQLKKHAQFTTHYIHSALASEILIGNRYYRSIVRSSALVCAIGNTNKKTTLEDIAPEFVSSTKAELRALYASEIVRLTDTVKQFKRGFVTLDAIQSDPQFTRLMALFWLYSNQVMKIQSEFEKCTVQQEPGVRLTVFYALLDKFNERKDIKRLFILSDVSEVSAMVPGLFDYDIVHLFDNARQSYAKYVRTVKHTLIRLTNDGLTSAFLSFAAIEPLMVTPEMAPKHGTLYQTLSSKSCANHIPSRHPVYGALRVQHCAHIPRTTDAVVNSVNGNIVRRDSKTRRVKQYVPVHATISEIRDRSIQSMATDASAACSRKIDTASGVRVV